MSSVPPAVQDNRKWFGRSSTVMGRPPVTSRGALTQALIVGSVAVDHGVVDARKVRYPMRSTPINNKIVTRRVTAEELSVEVME